MVCQKCKFFVLCRGINLVTNEIETRLLFSRY